MDLSLVKGESETVMGLVFSLLYLLLVLWIANKNHFFRLKKERGEIPLSVIHVFGIFFIYLFCAVIFSQLAYFILSYIAQGPLSADKDLSSQWVGWFQLASFVILFIILIIYCFCLRAPIRNYIFWGGEKKELSRFWKSLGMGVVGWLVSYPFVLVASLISNQIALLIWGKSSFEQVAVKQLKATMDQPILFVAMIFTVALLVPFMEELLFRGFLQNLIKKYLGRTWAIILTALLFALVHFSTSQGYGNFQLISSLSVLSIFLGFIYERERTLWAPIALHMSFNGFSILMILLS